MIKLNYPLTTLLNEFFYSYPETNKPPVERYPIYDESNTEVVGWVIQMALAGFSKEDIEVSYDDKLLYISGDNTKNDLIAEKFKCNFAHKYSLSNNIDVQNTKINFENGMLFIEVPVREKKQIKKLLFGK